MYVKSMKIFLAAGITLLVNTSDAQNKSLSAPIQEDTTVSIGKLSNGLEYYVQHNNYPEHKVELRLVLKAGSILEDSDQQGFAHFMEHMEFNGLKNFPKNALVDYLQKIGVGFGSDLNANTGFDRTYFILPIPTDNPKNIQTGFQIVRDWMDGASIDNQEVDAERNVIREELKMRDLNASTRMLKQYKNDLFNQSLYASRFPSGLDSIVAHGSQKRLKDFYQKWYRPDLMAVIVVGDLSKQKALAYVKQYFASIPARTNEAKRNIYKITPYTTTNTKIVTDKEAVDYGINVYYPSTLKDTTKTIQDVKNEFVRNIANAIINKRFSEASQNPKCSFISAYLDNSGTLGSLSLVNKNSEFSISPKKDIQKAIDSAFYILNQVRDFGVGKAEIEEESNNILAGLESAYQEKSKTSSSAYADAYADAFMNGEVPVSIDSYYDYGKELLPTITVDEVNAYLKKDLAVPNNYLTVMTAPDSGNIKIPTQAELATWIKDGFETKSKPYVATSIPTSLLEKNPTPGTIVQTTTNAKLGTITYLLSNGIRVTTKKTNYKNDEIEMSGIKAGGTNSLPLSEKVNYSFLNDAIPSMGYGQFTPLQLNQFLAGKNANLYVGANSVSSGLSGSSSVKDLNTLLQMTYLYLENPRKDTSLLDNIKQNLILNIPNQLNDPQTLFADTLQKVIYKNSPLSPISIPTTAQINSLNADSLVAIYKDLFSQSNGYHFYFVGNIDQEKLKPLLCQYIASIPKSDNYNNNPIIDNGLRRITGDNRLDFHKGKDNKALIINSYFGIDKYTARKDMVANILGQILTNRIIEEIREKKGWIYSGQVSGSVDRLPYENFNLEAEFPCDPKNIDSILSLYKSIVEKIAKHGPTKIDIEKVKKNLLENHVINIKTNDYWLSLIQSVDFYKQDPTPSLNFDKFINSISAKEIQDFTKKVLKSNNFIATSQPDKK